MQRDAAGFTLIELLTALAVLTIVTAVSVPSFAQIIERQRVEAALQRLGTDLALARNTAIARRSSVLVCPRSAEGDCQPGLDWSRGWMVLVETEDPPHPGQAGTPLWIQPALAEVIRLSANRPVLRYRHDGTSAGSNLTLHLCLHGQVVAQQIVSNSGRARRHQPEEGLACPG